MLNADKNRYFFVKYPNKRLKNTLYLFNYNLFNWERKAIFTFYVLIIEINKFRNLTLTMAQPIFSTVHHR